MFLFDRNSKMLVSLFPVREEDAHGSEVEGMEIEDNVSCRLMSLPTGTNNLCTM